MVEVIPALAIPLTAYIRREIGFNEFHDTLSRRAQIISDQSTEEGLELFFEILACIYEVHDRVMPEETFRQAIQEFLAKNPVPAVPVAVAD